MRKLLLGLLIIPAILYAETVVFFNTNTNRVTDIKYSANGPTYSGNPGVLIDPVIPSTATKFMLHDSGGLRAMTEAEMNTLLLAEEKAIKKSAIDAQVKSDVAEISELEFVGDWQDYLASKDDLSYPITVKKQDGSTTTLYTSTDVVNYQNTRISNIQGIIDAGETAKSLIDDCTYYYCVSPEDQGGGEGL